MIGQHLYGGWRRAHDLSVSKLCDLSGSTSLPRGCEFFELDTEIRSWRCARVSPDMNRQSEVYHWTGSISVVLFAQVDSPMQ